MVDVEKWADKMYDGITLRDMERRVRSLAAEVLRNAATSYLVDYGGRHRDCLSQQILLALADRYSSPVQEEKK